MNALVSTDCVFKGDTGTLYSNVVYYTASLLQLSGWYRGRHRPFASRYQYALLQQRINQLLHLDRGWWLGCHIESDAADIIHFVDYACGHLLEEPHVKLICFRGHEVCRHYRA